MRSANTPVFKQFNLRFQEVFKGFGASLSITSDAPEDLFLSSGYGIRERISILDATLRYAKLTLRQIFIKLALQTLLRKVKDGYTVYAFKYNSLLSANLENCR